MRNILVIKLRYIGDVLLATPVLSALRERFPDARLTMAVNRGTEDVVNGNPLLDDVLVVERQGIVKEVGLLREIRRRRFDCVIDLTDGDRSAIMTWCSRAPVRIGFNAEHRWRGRLYTDVVTVPDRIHRIDRDLAALRPLGIEYNGGPLVLIPSDDEYSHLKEILAEATAMEPGLTEKPLVMLHPGARYRFKAWPVERFAELADRLTEVGYRVLIGGGEHDRVTAQRIIDLAKSRPILLAGRLSLLQFAALVAQCRLFVGNDNGAMHMAAAMGTPVVGLFGPSDPAEWGPRGEKTAVLYKGLDCRRCFHPTCFRGEENCMMQITVDEVYAAAERLLTEDSRFEYRGSPQ